jgi:hypothetical protein
MTPAEFQTLHITQSPGMNTNTHTSNSITFSFSIVLIAPIQIDSTSSCCHCQNSFTNRFTKDSLRQLLVDMLQVNSFFTLSSISFISSKNDEEFVTGLHNAYTEKQNGLHRIYS